MLGFEDYADKYIDEEELTEEFEKENGREPTNEELLDLIDYEYQSYMSDKEDYDYEMYKDRQLFEDE